MGEDSQLVNKYNSLVLNVQNLDFFKAPLPDEKDNQIGASKQARAHFFS